MAPDAEDASVDFTPFVAEIVIDLWRELEERFPGVADLSEADHDAIVTALSKAGWRGLLRGVALITHEINKDSGVQVQTWVHTPEGPEPDMWAERHGPEGGED